MRISWNRCDTVVKPANSDATVTPRIGNRWTKMLKGTLGMIGATAAMIASAPAFAQALPDPGRWTFSITPYLWLPNVDGTLRYSAPSGASGSPEVDISADTLLSDLKAALMLAGEARHDRWAIFTDVMYLRFGGEESKVKSIDFVSVGRDPVSSNLDAGTSSTLKGLVWTLAGSYSVLDAHPGVLEVLGGLRYLGLKASTDWNLTATVTAPGGSATFPRSGSVSESEDIWTAIAGVRGRIPFGGSHWSMTYYGDVGAGSSASTYQWLVGLNYDFHWGGFILAYRQLYYDESSDKLVQSVRFSGPALGVTFRF